MTVYERTRGTIAGNDDAPQPLAQRVRGGEGLAINQRGDLAPGPDPSSIIELTSIAAEEASVAKTSRVVEEVVLGKEVSSRAKMAPKAVWNSEAARKQPQEVALQAVKRPMQVSHQAEYRNYRHLVERTIDVFGDELKASLWLSTPSPDMQGKVPMQVAQSVKYAHAELEKIFEPIFLRIEHGIYS